MHREVLVSDMDEIVDRRTKLYCTHLNWEFRKERGLRDEEKQLISEKEN